MKAVRIYHQGGVEGLVHEDAPHPRAAEGDVIVKVHAAGFTPGELSWPGTWTDRAGRDRTPTIPGHEVSGEVAELGLGTTGLTPGQRVVGLTDWCRNGTLAEYVAVEARNLAPLPAAVSHPDGAALPLAGLTAWQALFTHGRLMAGQTVVIHGAAGGVGTLAVQLAGESGAHVIGTGRARDRQTILGLGAHAFADLQAQWRQALDRPVDLVLDTIGGEVLDESVTVVSSGGTVVTISAPPAVHPERGRAIFFIVEPDRAQLAEIVARAADGRLRPHIGATHPLHEAPAAFTAKHRTRGKSIITVSSRTGVSC